MFILELADFRERIPGGDVVDWQPDSAMLAIKIIMALAPLIFMSIGIYISFKYRIDAKKQHEITNAIQNKLTNQEELIESL